MTTPKIRDQFMMLYGQLITIKELLGRQPSEDDQLIPYELLDNMVMDFRQIMIQLYGNDCADEEPEDEVV